MVDAVERAACAAARRSRPRGTTLLRATTPIGRIVLGDGIAGDAARRRRCDALRGAARDPRQRTRARGRPSASGSRTDLRERGCDGRDRDAPAGRGGQAPGGRRDARPASWPASGSSATSRSSRSVAARSATPPASSPRPTCAASRSSTSRRRSSPRSTRRSAARPAVDLPEGKNLVGAFHQPAAIVIDVAMLRTLPERQLRAALGEAVKMAALGDERLFELLERRRRGDRRGRAASLRRRAPWPSSSNARGWAKVEVVVADERERGAAGGRITLNLGHSLGHAVEAAAGYGELLHGEAVAYGLRAACRIGVEVGRHAAGAGRADQRPARRARAGDASRSPTRSSTVLEHLATDKKHADGRLRWVLPTADGVVVRDDIDPARGRAARPGSLLAAGSRAMTRVLVLAGPEPQPRRHARAGDLRPRDARRDPRRDRGPGRGARPRGRLLPVEPRGRADRSAAPARLRRRDRQRRRPDPHERGAARCAARRPAAVHRGPPVRSVARASRSGRSTSCTTSRSSRSSARAPAAITWPSSRSPGGSVAPVPDSGPAATAETAELRRLRRRIDALDRRIVALLNERAELAREAGRAKAAAGRRAIRDAEREREVLLRVTMANEGPMPQADLLALYRRLIAATRALEARDRERGRSAIGAADRTTPTDCGVPRGGAGPGSRRHRPATSTSATSPTRSGSGASPARSAAGSCCGSRTTTGCGAVPSTRRRCSRTWPGWVSRRRGPGPPVRRRRAVRGGARRGSAARASSTAATARGRRSRRGRTSTVARGTDPAVRAAAASAGSTGPVLRVGARRRFASVDGRDRRAVRRRGRRAAGDLPIRDRDGNWTYGFGGRRRRPAAGDRSGHPRSRPAARHADADPARRGCSGGTTPAAFAHHPLIRRPDGRSSPRPTATPGCATCVRPAGRPRT